MSGDDFNAMPTGAYNTGLVAIFFVMLSIAVSAVLVWKTKGAMRVAVVCALSFGLGAVATYIFLAHVWFVGGHLRCS